MEKILNVENEWDQMAKANVVEEPVEEVTYEVMKAMNKMKSGKATEPSEVNMNMIMASGKFGVIIKKLCQSILDGEDWPEEWKTSVVVPIFKGKGDVMDCQAYREIKLLEHAVERVLENRIRGWVVKDDMHLGFMPGWAQIVRCLFCERYERNSVEKRKRCACVL